MAASIQGSATVDKIDRSTREVTLRRHDGSLLTVVAGEEVRNFNQIRVGDIVEAEIIEAARGRRRARQHPGARAPRGGQRLRARPGTRPGASTTRTVEIVATVQEIDPKARLVTVARRAPDRAAQGRRLGRPRADQARDNVRAVYIETISIRVVPARR